MPMPTSPPPTPANGHPYSPSAGDSLRPSALNGIRRYLLSRDLKLLSPTRAVPTKPCARCLSVNIRCEDVALKIGHIANGLPQADSTYHLHIMGCGPCRAAGRTCSFAGTATLATKPRSTSPPPSTSLEKRKRDSQSPSGSPSSKTSRLRSPFNPTQPISHSGPSASTSSAPNNAQTLQAKVTGLFTQLADAKSKRRATAAVVEDRRQAVQVAFAELRDAQRELEQKNSTVADIEARFAQAQAALVAFDQQAAAMARQRGDGYRSALAAALEESTNLDNSLCDISGVFAEPDSD
ncbi:hypothetical protein CC85DRAFT_283271 [Cutaneotrichosporon oleaginosum]|uniref:Uncharacterized protein n=1 Tax=Cutaneotrichosporon oleaginosum TaxID=879819 RepID=A0A0J1B9U3_9TREE|nr:uncharacterized protein CC85DRAFT_283271 [Cutaneotrichosporon oleaginosum]KLT44629.1 hypothetical protein CC85DRAFT_283271 [Cutaneotrichosporon oleaginosum]TXT07615.1 hypothetical protein COLE_04539 [Cutaneotrichosporon oleaginosum]